MIEITDTAVSAPSQDGLYSHQVPQADLAIFKTIDVNADGQRVFRALTVPEYLETWISIPGAAPDSLTVASAEGNGYRLDHISPGLAPVRITGFFLFCHLRKIRLLWRKSANASCGRSLVDFRVRGNFARSILELRHTALGSADDYAWHVALWQRSLERLAHILRKS